MFKLLRFLKDITLSLTNPFKVNTCNFCFYNLFNSPLKNTKWRNFRDSFLASFINQSIIFNFPQAILFHEVDHESAMSVRSIFIPPRLHNANLRLFVSSSGLVESTPTLLSVLHYQSNLPFNLTYFITLFYPKWLTLTSSIKQGAGLLVLMPGGLCGSNNILLAGSPTPHS